MWNPTPEELERLFKIRQAKEKNQKAFIERYKKVKKEIPDDFIMTLLDWMLKLNLKPYELFVYAVIYQYSPPGSKSSYKGGVTYLQNSLHCDRKTVVAALSGLVAKKLISRNKMTETGQDVSRYEYAVILDKLPLSHTYINIQGWMFDYIKKPSELLVYAVIFSFSGPNSYSLYMGTTSYLCKVTALSKATVLRALYALEDAEKIYSKLNKKEYNRIGYEANYNKGAIDFYNKHCTKKEDFSPITYVSDEDAEWESQNVKF